MRKEKLTMIAQKVSIKINVAISALVVLLSYIIMCCISKTITPDIPVLIYTFVMAFIINLVIDVVRNYNILLDKYNALTTDFERLIQNYNEQKKLVGSINYNLQNLLKQRKEAQIANEQK